MKKVILTQTADVITLDQLPRYCIIGFHVRNNQKGYIHPTCAVSRSDCKFRLCPVSKGVFSGDSWGSDYGYNTIQDAIKAIPSPTEILTFDTAQELFKWLSE